MPVIDWTEDGHAHSATWHSESNAPAPDRVLVIGDETNANTAYRLARKGTALLWRGDFHNARQLLSAMARRVDRDLSRRGDRKTAREAFFAQREARAERAAVLGRLIVELDADHSLNLRRAPDVRDACRDAYGEPDSAMCVSLTELQGVLSARGWYEKGVPIPALDARIHPRYGVFSPVRGEYVHLVARAPIPAEAITAFDLGTGTGVLAALLARRGMEGIVATDINERAVECANENFARLGWSDRAYAVEADLFPDGEADLIVCNPPWLPAQPTSALELGIYDEDSSVLHRFLDGTAEHLKPGGEAWLIISDLAEHLGLRTRSDLLDRIATAGLRVIDRLDTTPTHGRATDESDPLHAARSREVTSLWRLEIATD
ncbi:class I SAM-dependent methyltransferase [Brevibacterium sp.]|uniref:class I SAM-dependent methyltransferase n=1 Tax=Brevibacterium sp. TaxID=1701 RepID=UPI002811A69D|nr:class I SAM-dependent methyltransferase [Brevibacterium sp.]